MGKGASAALKTNGKFPAKLAAPESSALLAALQALRDGDYSVRLPGGRAGLDGKIADTFNDIVATHQRAGGLAERQRLETDLHESHRRKDEFLATLAHELRNPLAPIRSAVDILNLKALHDPDLVHCRTVVERQVEHLTRLVDDLMDVSRISRGQIALERQALEVSTIVTRAVEMQRAVFTARKQKFTVKQPAYPLVVEGDLTRLADVLSNLLNNAAKYTGERGQITLHVEQAADAETVLLRVKDNGQGIPRDLLPKVFEMFTQIDHTLQRAQGGLGIGLALVRKLAEMHGGSVEGFSEGLGKGSEFVLRLPLRTDLRVAQARALLLESPKTLSQRRILVVDDNRDAAMTLALTLRLNGAHVDTLHDGRRAVETAERLRPEMVLLDIGMPGISGLDVARALRAQPWGAPLLLIALTGWSTAADRQRTRAAGFDEHLTKPIDYSRLSRLLADFSARKEKKAAPDFCGLSEPSAILAQAGTRIPV